jgi:hypothetical protein
VQTVLFCGQKEISLSVTAFHVSSLAYFSGSVKETKFFYSSDLPSRALSVIENLSDCRLSQDFSPPVMFLLSVRLTYVLNCDLRFSVFCHAVCSSNKNKTSDQLYSLKFKPKQKSHINTKTTPIWDIVPCSLLEVD